MTLEQRPFGTDDFASNPDPRLASVLLLDVSGSMGEVVADVGVDTGRTVEQDGRTYRVVSGGRTRIDLLNEGLAAYREDLFSDPLALSRVELALVTFGGEVRTVSDFSSVSSFHPPLLTATGGTPMGAAVLHGLDLLRRRKETYKTHGVAYFRPWVFLVTDGEPTDDWKQAAELVRQGEASKAFSFFTVGVEGANFDLLAKLGIRQPLKLQGLKFREMFLWLSASQASVSRSSPGDTVPLSSPTAGPQGWASV